MATGERPTFSIVIPTRSRPAQLAACLAAIARLDYPRDRIEVIVVDDGGGSTSSIDQPFDGLSINRIVQPHAGPAAARNNGAGHASGEFLAFTDDDCEPDPNWLNALLERLRSRPEAAVGGRTINGLPDNPYSTASEEIVGYLYMHLNRDMERARFLTSNNFALPADRFREVGGFNERFTLAAGEDRDFCDRWRARGYSLAYAPEAIVRHAHALSLIAFISQQFNYGRAAFHFRSRQPLSFYLRLLAHPFTTSSQRHGAVQQALLFVVSQACIVAGCGWAALFGPSPA
jgi:GT2 family glycosyltransferase